MSGIETQGKNESAEHGLVRRRRRRVKCEECPEGKENNTTATHGLCVGKGFSIRAAKKVHQSIVVVQNRFRLYAEEEKYTERDEGRRKISYDSSTSRAISRPIKAQSVTEIRIDLARTGTAK